ncbi:MAG: PEP-CTERM sorting domain-containing protein [Phycisphaerae bacterium]|nr:PEP-CTERM sorting domain-containing protein [Phycisphaerae bacterium]
MRRACLFVVCLLAVPAAAVDLTMDNLGANGWKATATFVWGGSTNASVTETSDYGADNFRFYTGPMNTSWQFQWAGISTDAFAGTKLSAITSVKIRNFGAFGDNPYRWQPPTFTWIVDKGDGNQRCITWQPWATTDPVTAGNPREPLVWHEYDAATTGQWFLEETETFYSSLSALKAALPNAYFEYTAELPLDWGYASQQAFNVGNCPLYDGDRGWFTDTAGYVDWFEVGVNGVVTRYDLVPEPGSLVALVTGFVGLLGLRRRK